jgi:uncharacterized protein YndB with AHSA1/START domain
MAKAGEQAISNDAVKAKTGKTWNQWFRILDRWGAIEKDHKSIARHLHSRHGLSGWWSQAVTVRYEQDRGLRDIGQRASGKFELSVQRTIATAMHKAFAAFTDPAIMSVWFTTKAKGDVRVGGTYTNSDGDRGTYLLIDAPKRLKFTWDNAKHCPGTVVDITFTSAGRNKTVVRLQHFKLKSMKDRENMKGGWSWAMDSLKSYLETGDPIRHEDWLKQRRK